MCVALTDSAAQVVDVDEGVTGAGGEQAVQLRLAGVLMVPAQCVDEFMVLLHGAQKRQTRRLVHFYRAANKYNSFVFVWIKSARAFKRKKQQKRKRSELRLRTIQKQR